MKTNHLPFTLLTSSFTWHAVALSLGASLLFTSTVFPQGSLAPPVGPPAPTMKSLDQIASTGIAINNTNTPGDANYHFIISAAGSYFLTGNLAVTKTNGIHITTAGVTVDLNGFQILRSTGSGGDGITISLTANRCTVKNGTIAGAFVFGINGNPGGPNISGGEFSHLAVSGCTGAGLRAANAWRIENCAAHNNPGFGIISNSGIIVNCTAMSNTATGISGAFYSNVQNCTSNFNGGDGISVNFGSNVSHCTIAQNSGNGLSIADQSNVTDCTITLNQGIGVTSNGGDNSAIVSSTVNENGGGISLHDAGSVTHCTADGNNNYGISVHNNCAVTGCNASSNLFDGIATGADCTIKDCTASSSDRNGIFAADVRCLILNCTANSNGRTQTADGIKCSAHSTVKNCNASNNKGNGIEILGDSLVLESQCNNNTVDGIHATGDVNRIDSNHTCYNTGIGINAGHDWVVRNSSGANTGGTIVGVGADIAPSQTASTATNPFANMP